MGFFYIFKKKKESKNEEFSAIMLPKDAVDQYLIALITPKDYHRLKNYIQASISSLACFFCCNHAAL